MVPKCSEYKSNEVDNLDVSQRKCKELNLSEKAKFSIRKEKERLYTEIVKICGVWFAYEISSRSSFMC